MTTLMSRIAKLRNTVSLRTFPRDLNLLYTWPYKTNIFFGMNHDFVRTCIILRLMEALESDAFVETGTHLGRTSFLIASQTNLPVFTSEVNRKYSRIASLFLTCFGSRVHLSRQDSVKFLNGLLAYEKFERPLFYLDAHWYSRLPLMEELSTILKSVHRFSIVIDDFRVPGDSNFGFDRYDNASVEWELIQQVLIDSGRSMVAYLPSYPSSLEVGDRRGWILIASLEDEKLITETVPSELLRIHAVIDKSISLMPMRAIA